AADGRVFAADRPAAEDPGGFEGGRSRAYHDAPPAGGIAEPILCATCRQGDFQYRFRLAGGEYWVRLIFAEHEDFVIHGVRRFAVRIGAWADWEIDIYAEAWRHRATWRSAAVRPEAGELSLSVTSATPEWPAQLCAIEIVPASASDPPPPPTAEVRGGFQRISLSFPVPESPGVEGFRIARGATAEGPFHDLHDTPRPAAVFHDEVHNGGREFYYRVCAVDLAGRRGPFGPPMAGAALAEADAALPVYRLSVPESLLARLEIDPWSNEEVPGAISRGERAVAPVGVRYRGLISRTFPRKSWKVRVDAYLPEAELDGKDVLNFNAQWTDPTGLHEVLALHTLSRFCRLGIACYPIHLELNGRFHGVYTWNEQVERRFFRGYGINDPVVYKAFPLGPPCDLSLLDGPHAYQEAYEKKTHTEEGHHDLIAFIETLNRTPDEEFAGVITPIFDVDDFLDQHAVTLLTGDWDKYGNNFYLYREFDEERWRFLPFDHDHAFEWLMPADWGRDRFILPRRILEQPVFEMLYTRKLRGILETWWRPEKLGAQIDSLAALVRPEIVHDHRRAFDPESFEEAAAALHEYLALRRELFLAEIAGRWDDPLHIAELMPAGADPIRDAAGEAEPWIEIVNTSTAPYPLGEVWISPELHRPRAGRLPDTVLPPGGRLLLWADGEPEEGPRHLSFRWEPSAARCIGLFRESPPHTVPLDAVFFPPLSPGSSFGRYPEDGETWTVFAAPTPGEANRYKAGSTPALRLNELAADNRTLFRDAYGEYDDWFELLNPTPAPAAAVELYATDDAARPLAHPLPAMMLAPGEPVVIWADGQPEQGLRHLGFRLAREGEALYLYRRRGAAAALVDSVSFGPQAPDQSWARRPDGHGVWVTAEHPTPGLSNVLDLSGPQAIRLLPARPNPFRGETRLGFFLLPGARGREAQVEIYDVAGRLRQRMRRSLGEARSSEIIWNGRDRRQDRVAAGVYFIRLRVGEHDATRKVIRLR
ncbi:MAG: T9SS type A sorting domain-containing protein, partial [Candidatus Eisenbacteria bacterium]|nr:T9SS type A sorting domain-containing protein [Candidatus Eisenbacteria bacterium]